MSKKSNNLANGESSIIGAGTVLEGNLKSTSTLRIDGEIIGDVHSEGTVIVGTDGKIKGNIKVMDLLVAGTVIGDVTAENKIEIVAKGKLKGDINTKGLIIDEAALFQGNCVMIDETLNQETKADEMV